MNVTSAELYISYAFLGLDCILWISVKKMYPSLLFLSTELDG